jgi:hypothetical protein
MLQADMLEPPAGRHPRRISLVARPYGGLGAPAAALAEYLAGKPRKRG